MLKSFAAALAATLLAGTAFGQQSPGKLVALLVRRLRIRPLEADGVEVHRGPRFGPEDAARRRRLRRDALVRLPRSVAARP